MRPSPKLPTRRSPPNPPKPCVGAIARPHGALRLPRVATRCRSVWGAFIRITLFTCPFWPIDGREPSLASRALTDSPMPSRAAFYGCEPESLRLRSRLYVPGVDGGYSGSHLTRSRGPDQPPQVAGKPGPKSARNGQVSAVTRID